MVVAIDARRAGAERRRRLGGVHPRRAHRRPGIDAVAWAERVRGLGAGEILLTSMDRDGTRDGFDLELTRRWSTLSGPGGRLRRGRRRSTIWSRGPWTGGADAVLAASIFHFGEATVAEAKAHLAAAGVAVRPG